MRLGNVLTGMGLGLMRALGLLPLAWLRGLGAALGWLLYGLARKRRHVVMCNLRLCFPHLSEAERLRLTRQSFVYFAQAWLDRGWLWHASQERLVRRLHLHGALHEFEGTDATVVFSPHFYGLDAGATAVTMQVARPFSTIYTRQSNRKIDAWIHAGRRRWGQVRLFSRTDGIKDNVAGLRRGEVLFLLPDMDFGADGSVFVPFFGVSAATVPSLARFARLGRAKVVPLIARMTDTGYDIEVLPAWQDYPSGDLQADTALANERLERWILTMPAQYYWVHRRFKSRPPGEPAAY
jgi:KDO2-lipid IV(A) lauroyltransferase